MIVIYCKSLKTVGRVFCHLKAELGEGAWVNKKQKFENLLIAMFHSKTLLHHKDSVLKSLNGEGNCRVIVATTALGMGINVPNVSHVFIYGSPENVEAIVQQVGRAGRDGLQSHVILYNIKQLTRGDVAVREVLDKSLKSCFRQAHILNRLQLVLPLVICAAYFANHNVHVKVIVVQSPHQYMNHFKMMLPIHQSAER